MLPKFPDITIPLISSIGAIIEFVNTTSPVEEQIDGRLERVSSQPRYYCRT